MIFLIRAACCCPNMEWFWFYIGQIESQGLIYIYPMNDVLSLWDAIFCFSIELISQPLYLDISFFFFYFLNVPFLTFLVFFFLKQLVVLGVIYRYM